jgi:copper chaperone CopZ
MDSEYTVTGMTCGHCVRAVSAEIERLPGVRRVEVDLATGVVRVSSDRPLEPELVRAAVDEAGYELAGA